MSRPVALVLTSLLVWSAGAALRADIDPELATIYFAEVEQLCRQDDGELWGISLCGPLLFVEPDSRRVVANQKGHLDHWERFGKLWVARLPPDLPVANTTLAWAGLEWTMVVWPPPVDAGERAELLLHESWHRVQRALGFPATSPDNGHLDRLEGRYWMLLEMRALATALVREGEARMRAATDAVCFRNHRRSLYPEAGEEERALENHEGLAAYTGVRLRASAHPEGGLAQGLADAASRPTLVRSFAYGTGPAYGLLLDEKAPHWRREMDASQDLAGLLTDAMALDPAAVDPREAAVRYGGVELRAEEERRELVRVARQDELRARLVEGPVLVLPLRDMKMQFDPGELVPLTGEGTVYPAIRIGDEWGILAVRDGGALMSGDFTRVRISAPPDPDLRPLAGDGWSLELAEGWQPVAGERDGDFTLRMEERP